MSNASGRIFLHHRDGKTLWVAKHTPTPQDIGKVVLVAQIPAEELAQSFYLFDTHVTLVGDDARRAVYDPSAKTDKNVIDAVNSFRSECAKAQDVAGFLQAKLYKAPSIPAMMVQGQHQQHQPMLQHQQYQNQQVAYGGSGTVGWGNEGNVVNANQGSNSGSYGGNVAFQQGGYGGGGYNGQQQQWGQQQAMMGGVNPQYGGGMGMGHGMIHPGNMNQGPNGYHPHQPQGAMMVPPYGAPQMGMMYSGRGRGAGGMMRGRGLPSDQMCSEDEVLREPEPLDEFPVEVPEDIRRYYVNSRKKIYVAALPSSKMTVWMRSHEPNPQNYRRYANSANGLTLLMNATVEEIIDSKPVELFDRQLCTFFITRGHCARRGCLHTHRTEEQVKSLIACRHVQLESASKAERRGFVDLIIEREKRMMLEKGTTLPKPEGAVKALRPITPATEAAVARARAEAGHGPEHDDIPVPIIESTDEDDEEVIVSALKEEGILVEGLTEDERKEKILAEKNRRRNERRNAREARKLELQMLSNATKALTGAGNNLMISANMSQGPNARGIPQHPGAPNRAVTLGFARPEQVHIKPPRIPRDARIGIATSSDDSSSSSSSSSSDSSSSDSDDDSNTKKARKDDEKKERELKKRHRKVIQEFDVNMFVLRLEIKDNEKKAFKKIKIEAKEGLTAIKEGKTNKTKIHEGPITSTGSINDTAEEKESNDTSESLLILKTTECESSKNDTKEYVHEEDNKRYGKIEPATKRNRSRTPVPTPCTEERSEVVQKGGRRKKK